MNAPVAAIDVPAARAMSFVTREFGVSETLLANQRRRAGLVRPRALFAWVLRHHAVSFARIAAALNCQSDDAIRFYRVATELRRVAPEFVQLCDRYLAEEAAGRG